MSLVHPVQTLPGHPRILHHHSLQDSDPESATVNHTVLESRVTL
jgi:hypothetical protein